MTTMTEQEFEELKKLRPDLLPKPCPDAPQGARVGFKAQTGSEQWAGQGKGLKRGNKYGAVRTYSELCGRTFDSKAEARRGEQLKLLERAGEIENLEYQIPFRLCDKPKITVTIDFCYDQYPIVGKIYEDVKGVLTRDSRTRYAWLKEKYGIEVELIK